MDNSRRRTPDAVVQTDAGMRTEVATLPLDAELDPAARDTAALNTEFPVSPLLGPGQSALLSTGELVAGRFVILRFVARGGMGAVYEADDVVLHSRVALKVLEGKLAAESAAMERFHREVLLARRVTHPNVCRVYEFYEATTASGLPIRFLTMELLEGETLSSYIRREGRLSPAEALPLVQQMCNGLAAAHAEGVIHRDFKSANVILVPRADTGSRANTRVAITDFGIARALRQAKPRGEEALTGGAEFLGTPAYMAPEQVTGSDVSPATDVYALGVVLYEMMTGRLPFSADSPLATAMRHIEEAPLSPELIAPGLDPRWSRIILRCLDREPSRRFQDATDVAAALAGELPQGRQPQSTTVAGARPSIAVLAFADMSPDHDQEYFSDGIAEEIISALTQVPGLRVVGRSSSFSFKGRSEDLRAVGQKLNVMHVLEGSVRKAGGRLRITTQVVNAANGYQVWSQTFDRELADIFAVQDEVARAVVTALSGGVLPRWEGKAWGQVTTPDVYATYLRGLQFANTGSHMGVRKGIAEFQRAIDLDPNYAPAHASLASALLFYGISTPSSEPSYDDWRRRGLEEAEKAVAEDPRLPDAYVARAYAHNTVTWNWAAAQRDLEHALTLAPGNTLALRRYSTLLLTLGRKMDAVANARLAVDLDPLSADAYYELGAIHMRLGQYASARSAIDRAISLAPSHFSAWLQWCVELLDGDPKKALAFSETAPDEFVRNFGAALSWYRLGDNAASERALSQIISSDGNLAPVNIAEVYAWRGERESAFEWLERAYSDRDPDLAGIKTRPLLSSLRGDPRYSALLERLVLPPD